MAEQVTSILPKKKKPGVVTVEQAMFLLHGEPKIGKTSFVNSVFPEALFLSTDRGTKFLDCYSLNISNWSQFKQVVASLIKEKPKQYSTIIVDLVEDIYEFCLNKVCSDNNVIYPSDIDAEGQGWGKGWKLVKKEFTKANKALMSTGYGIVYISVTIPKTRRLASGMTVTKNEMALTESPRNLLIKEVDYAMFVEQIEENFEDKSGNLVTQERRYLRTRNSVNYIAGCRGREGVPLLPDKIPFHSKSFRKVYSQAMTNLKTNGGGKKNG